MCSILKNFGSSSTFLTNHIPRYSTYCHSILYCVTYLISLCDFIRLLFLFHCSLFNSISSPPFTSLWMHCSHFYDTNHSFHLPSNILLVLINNLHYYYFNSSRELPSTVSESKQQPLFILLYLQKSTFTTASTTFSKVR